MFTKLNLNFGFLSLNVRGIRSFDKRKALFHWCMKDKADIIFLQETYSTPEVENVWKSQWRGELFFSHGSEHSRGVLTSLCLQNRHTRGGECLEVPVEGRAVF